MHGDFLTAQLAAAGPLDFVRFWIPGEGTDAYRLVAEVIREEDDGGFSIVVPAEIAASSRATLVEAGFEGSSKRLKECADSEVAETTRGVLALVAPDATKVSLTHGTRDEMVRRRRLDAVVATANEILGAQAAPGAWVNDSKIPIQFRSGTVQLTLWPKHSPPDVVLEVWAFVANAVPDRTEVGDLITRCNEGFSYGRLLRQEDRVWYRETIHADPLSSAALNLAVQIAANTARQYGPRFADLGAADGSAPEPTPAGVPERPPDAAVTRPTGGYL